LFFRQNWNKIPTFFPY